MIRRLQRLKAKRGFTILELIVVIAIIGIMIGTLLFSSRGKREKIEEANSTASDFYSALQTEFTNFQMFDGPLTMTLNKEYAKDYIIAANNEYGGIKYYPAVGGNYPYAGVRFVGEKHDTEVPKTSVLYLKFYVFGGSVRRVNYANDLSTLVSMSGTGNDKAQICLVLKEEMKERMQYKDGYYYARVSYTEPYGISLTKYDYRTKPVRVDWTCFMNDPITTNTNTSTFKSQNWLLKNGVCGVHTTTDFPTLGTTGTNIMDF